jgi:hypothetical protein
MPVPVSDAAPAPTPPVLAEIQSGDGLSLAAAGRLFPGHRGSPAVDPSTVFRWKAKGLPAGGRTVKLEAVRVGGRWLTSGAAVARFVAALTAAAAPPDPVSSQPATRTPTARRRAAEKAAAALKAMGA